MPSTAGLPSRIAGQLPLTICIYRSFSLHASPLLLSLYLPLSLSLLFASLSPFFVFTSVSLPSLSLSLFTLFVSLIIAYYP
jgi:hypothetical protein